MKNEKINQGYLPLSRKLFENPLWKEKRKFSRAEAWIDLLQLAAFDDDKKFYSPSGVIQLKVGETVASIRFLIERWGWGTNKVYLFLSLLESEDMIDKRVEKGCSVIRICNYEKYKLTASNPRQKDLSSSRAKSGTRSETNTEHQTEHENPPQASVSEDLRNDERNENETESGTKTEHERNDNNNYNKVKKERDSAHETSSFQPIQDENYPTKDEVRSNFRSNGGTDLMADAFHDKWSAKGWKDKDGPIENYTFLISGFIRRWKENDKKTNQQQASGRPLTRAEKQDLANR